MEYRQPGRSGLAAPVLSLGTATFGGGTEFFKAWGSTDAKGATRLVDLCLDAGISMFDSADVYSNGLAEEFFLLQKEFSRNYIPDKSDLSP